MTDFLTTQQAADILGVDSSAVRRLCIDGVLTAEKFGHMWRIANDDTFTEYAANPRRQQGRGRPRLTETESAESDTLPQGAQ